MRDTRKSASYFESYLEYEENQAEKRAEKLNACDDEEKKTRINSNLLLNRMRVLCASFSYGVTQDELKTLLMFACATAGEVRSLTYSDALTLASFAVMLDEKVAIRPLFERFQDVFVHDKLLSGFMSYIECGTATWVGDYQFTTPYAGLDVVISATDKKAKETALLAYLKSWYNQCDDCAWYDSLSSSSDIYYGYWSFESAAIAKIFGLDESVLAQSPYYPKL